MPIYFRSSVAAAAMLCAAANADITEVAPADAFAVANIPDIAELKASVEGSPLNDLWNHPEVQAFITAFIEDAEDEMTDDASLDWWSELEYFDGEPITTRILLLDHLLPDVSLGMAFWTNAEQIDDGPEIIMHADFGQRAGDIQDLFDQALDKGLEDELITYEKDDYGPATIYSITFTDAEFEEEFEGMGFDDTIGIDQFQQEMYITRIGDSFLIGSSIGAVERAVDASDGDAGTLGESEQHQAFLAQHPDDLLAYAYVRPDSLVDSLSGGTGFLFDVPMPILDSVGITEVNSVGISMSMGGDGALVSSRITAAMPEKTGIATLFDLDRDGYTPPAFAGADTAQINSLLFDFKGVFALAHKIAAGFPADEGEFYEMQITQAEGMVGPLLQVLGPNVHIVERYRMPFGFDSQERLIAIQLNDELAASNLITVFGGGMGLEARQFEGSQIYESEMAPFSIGIGAGHAFIGPGEMIENAFRRAADPGQNTLGSEPAYIAAAKELEGTGNLIGYSNTKRVVEFSFWMLENIEEINRKMYEEWGFEGEELEEMLATLRENTPEFISMLPSSEVISEIVGDQVWEMKSTDEGFVLDTKLMPAAN